MFLALGVELADESRQGGEGERVKRDHALRDLGLAITTWVISMERVPAARSSPRGLPGQADRDQASVALTPGRSAKRALASKVRTIRSVCTA